MIEENEAYRKIIECVEGGNDDEVEAKIQWYLMKAQESRVFGEVRREVVECGIRGAVEKKRKGRGREEEQSAGQEQGREVRSRKEEQSGETEAQSTEKQKVISGAEELRTGRGERRSCQRRRREVSDERDLQKRERKRQWRKRRTWRKGEIWK